MVPVRMNWYEFGIFGGGSVRSVVDIAIVQILSISIIVGLIAAYLGSDSLRSRLGWLSASLFAPASLFLLAGMTLTSSLIIGPVSNSVATVRWDGVPYSDAYREAVVSVIIPVMHQVGNGILLTGFVACAIAFALLVWSWITPDHAPRPGKIVQAPAHNV